MYQVCTKPRPYSPPRWLASKNIWQKIIGATVPLSKPLPRQNLKTSRGGSAKIGEMGYAGDMTKGYAKELQALLSPAERTVFKMLNTPQKIQDYLDKLPINFELKGETIYSPRRVLREGSAHCVEGALFAAAALAYHGRAPYLMDIQTTPDDYDHVVALFKEGGRWGAISKTNHAILRWRDPVYRTPRELALSYFHEYILDPGKKTMRAYSKPFDLSRYAPEWAVAEEDLSDLIEMLDDSPHSPVASKATMSKLRRASPLERKMLDLTEWGENGKIKKL